MKISRLLLLALVTMGAACSTSLKDDALVAQWKCRYEKSYKRGRVIQIMSAAGLTIGVSYWLYKTFLADGVTEARDVIDYIDQTPGLLPKLRQVMQAHEQTEQRYDIFARAYRWIKGSVPSVALFVGSQIAYQAVAAPFSNLFYGPVVRQLYEYALGAVEVRTEDHWLLARQVRLPQKTTVACVFWWGLRALDRLDTAIEEDNAEIIWQAACEIYAHIQYVADHHTQNKKEQRILRGIADEFDDFAQSLMAPVTGSGDEQHESVSRRKVCHDNCKSILGQLRLCSPYRVFDDTSQTAGFGLVSEP